MSIRYGIDLVLQPSFTAKVYKTRQIVCGQYSAWAAEMQMLRMALTPYFPCPNDRLPVLTAQVESIASESRSQQPCLLTRAGIVADQAMNGVVMEFEASTELLNLQRMAQGAAQSHSDGLLAEPFSPRIALLELVHSRRRYCPTQWSSPREWRRAWMCRRQLPCGACC